jgi:pimeloyl-ACP methyl ester carboxylesterase
VIALDRPGYGAPAPYPDAMQHSEQRVALAYGAVDKILGSNARGAGLFLLAHSAGCELAVRMAVDERAEHAGILGLEMAGTGLQFADAASDIMKAATATGRPTGLRELLWEPAHLYPGDVLSGMTNSSGGAPYEIGVTKSWAAQDFPALAAKIGVPVQFSVAEYEGVWRSDPEALAEVAALFTATPRFVLNEQPETGHNMSLSVSAEAYHTKVLSFVRECVAAQQGTSKELEAG